MKTIFNTNLDLAKPYLEQYDDAIFVPQIGSRLEFSFPGAKKTFELEVCSVTYKHTGQLDAYYVCVDLHIPKYHMKSIKEWEAWFSKHERSM